MAGVAEFDTFGAWLLERLTRQGSVAGRAASVVGLPDHDRNLLEEMHGVNLKVTAALRPAMGHRRPAWRPSVRAPSASAKT